MRRAARGAGAARWAVLLISILGPAVARSSCETKPGDYHLIALPPDRTPPNEWMPPGAGACGHYTARVSAEGQVSLFARYALPQPWASWCNHLEYRGFMGGFASASTLAGDGDDGGGDGGGGKGGGGGRSSLQEERLGRRRRRRRRRALLLARAVAESGTATEDGDSSNRNSNSSSSSSSSSSTGIGATNATQQAAPAAALAAALDAAQEAGGPFTTSVPLTLFDAGVELPPSALITLVGLPPGTGASGTGDGANATAAAAAAAGAKAPLPVLADGPAIVRLRMCTEGGCDSVDFALVTPSACLLGTISSDKPCARAGTTDAGTLAIQGGSGGGGGRRNGASASAPSPPPTATGAKLATCLPCYLGSQRLEGLALLPGPPVSKSAAAAVGELKGNYSACVACPPGTAAPPPPTADDATGANSSSSTSSSSASGASAASAAAAATPAPGTCLSCPGGTISGVYAAKRCLSECAPGTYAPPGASGCVPCPGGGYQRDAAAASCAACPADSWSSGVFFEAGQGCLRCSNGRKCATVPVRDPPDLAPAQQQQQQTGGDNSTAAAAADPAAAALAAAVASVSDDRDAQLAALRRQNTDAAPLCAPSGSPQHFDSSRHAPRFVLVDASPANDACLRVAAAAAQLSRVTIVLDRTCEAPVWYGAEPPPSAEEGGKSSSSSSSAATVPDAEPALLAGFVLRGGGLRPPGARAPYAARTVSSPPIRYASSGGGGGGGSSSPITPLFAEAHQVVLERGDHGGLFSRQLAGDDAAAALGRMWRATQPSRLSLYGAGYLPELSDPKRGLVVFGPPADLGLVGEPSCRYTLRLADDVFYEMKPAPCPPGERGCAPAAAAAKGGGGGGGNKGACGAGRYRVPLPQDTAACAYCPPGTASADGARESCDPCPPGTYAQGVGNARCEPCARGFVATLAGAAACLPCGFELAVPTAMPAAGSQAAKGVAFYADPKAAKAGADAAAAAKDIATGASGRYTRWRAADRACEPCPPGSVSSLPSPTGAGKCFSIDPRTRAPCCATCAPGTSADACPADVARGGEAVAAAAANGNNKAEQQQNGGGGGGGGSGGGDFASALGASDGPAAASFAAPAAAPVDPFVGTQVAGAVLSIVGEPQDVELPPTSAPGPDGQARPSSEASAESLGGGGCSGEPFGEALRCLRQFGAYLGYRLGPPLECRYQRLPLPDMVLALEIGPASDALAKAAALAARSADNRGGGGGGGAGGGGGGGNGTAGGNNATSSAFPPRALVNPFVAAAQQGAMLELRRCRALLGSTLFPGQGFLLDSSAVWLDAPAPEVSPWPQAFRMRPGAPGVDPLDLSPRGHRALVQPGAAKGEIELTLWDYSRYGAGRQGAYDSPPYTPPLPSDAATPLRGCRVRLSVRAGSVLGVSAADANTAANASRAACPPGTEPSGPACLMCASDTASDGKGGCVACEPPRVAPFPGMGGCVASESTPAAVQADLLSPTPPGSTALGGNPATCEGEFGFGTRRRRRRRQL